MLELTLAQAGWYALYLFLGLYIPEFIADRFKWVYARPSWVLINLAAWATDAAMALGRFIGWVSSFVDYLRFEIFYVPLFKLLKPSYDLCISWLWIFTGYVDFAEKFKRTGVVYWGSYLLIAAAWTGGTYVLEMYTDLQWPNFVSRLVTAGVWGLITYGLIGLLYFGGNTMHEAVKYVWNLFNKDNVLLVGRSNVLKKAAEAEAAPVDDSDAAYPVAADNGTKHKKK